MMSLLYKFRVVCGAILLAASAGFSTPLLADAVEQTVRIDFTQATDGSQCKAQAVFRGDHDNCKNDKAKGRADCSAESGCVCTRQEKHVTWNAGDKQSFTIAFDQGSANPFVVKGDSECKLRSNKKGKLRCRVKGKDVPRGDYRYSIITPECGTTVSHIKIY
jgi:hypothetical protein